MMHNEAALEDDLNTMWQRQRLRWALDGREMVCWVAQIVVLSVVVWPRQVACLAVISHSNFHSEALEPRPVSLLSRSVRSAVHIQCFFALS